MTEFSKHALPPPTRPFREGILVLYGGSASLSVNAFGVVLQRIRVRSTDHGCK